MDRSVTQVIADEQELLDLGANVKSEGQIEP